MKPIIYLLPIAAVVMLGGCQGRQDMDNTNDSFDSPGVLAVVFHPRPERAAPVSGTQFETLAVPVGQGNDHFEGWAPLTIKRVRERL